jgi:hypothetical protein
MGNTAAWILDLGSIVQLEEDVVDRFVTLAVLSLDTSSIDVLDESFDALAAAATGLSRWALEVLHGLGLAGLSA